MKYLDENDIEDITLEIANMRRVEPELKEAVLEEFYELCLAQNYLAVGGIDYAKEMLEKALGPVKAGTIIQKLVSSLQIRPFDFARKTEPTQLLNFIQNEHPQTIALIMSYLHPEQAGAILSALPATQQVEVARRIATMDRTSPEVLKEIETVLEKRLSSFVLQDFNMAGGVETAVAILNRVDRGTEKPSSNLWKKKTRNWRKRSRNGCLSSRILLPWMTVRSRESSGKWIGRIWPWP